MAERRLESIAAEQNVIIDSGEIHASGQNVKYSVPTDLVELSGAPKWRAGRQDGSAEQLTIERTNKVFRANGNAVLRMAGQGASGGDFLPGNSLVKTNIPGTNEIVEIRCHSYELRTNSAFFRDDVRLTQRVDDQARGQLTCALLSVEFAGTNQLRSMAAEKNVVLEREDNRFTAGRAVYTGSNGIMALTENPAWKAAAREGKGDVIQVNVPKNEMRVDGNAFMRLPAEEMGQAAVAKIQNPKSKIQNPAPLAQAVSPSEREIQNPKSKTQNPEFANVFCERYTVNPQGALFEGKVRLEHPQMRWNCDTVSAEFGSPDGKSGRIIGERDVAFDLTDEKGGKVHGTGQKAVYIFGVSDNQTNNFVELTGNPVIVTTNGSVQNATIIVDVATHTLALPGKFRIVGTGPVATNLFFK